MSVVAENVENEAESIDNQTLILNELRIISLILAEMNNIDVDELRESINENIGD